MDRQVGQEASFKNAQKWAWFQGKVGVAPKISGAFCAHYLIETPLRNLASTNAYPNVYING